MELQNLYNKIQQESKINDDDFLMECLEFYKNSHRSYGGLRNDKTRKSDFYDKLIKVDEIPDLTNVNIGSEEKFYVMMTNIWIESIMSLMENDIKSNRLKYKEIKEIVSKIKKVNSLGEVISLYGEISDILDDEQDMDHKNLFWRSDQEKMGFIRSKECETGFYHVQSRYVNARKTNNISSVDYRLYINCKKEDIFELMSLYVVLCRKRQIPYYFKFGADKNRKDKFIVYCPKELLLENIEILKEIAKIKPDIPKKCGEMLSLVGNIDDWIGIASEPKKIEGKGKFSYNTMRAEILEDSAELMMIKFVEKYRGKTLNINDRTINFDMLLAESAAKIVIKEMLNEGKMIKNESNISKYVYEIMNSLLSKKDEGILLDKALVRIKEVMPEKNNLIASNSKPIFCINLSNGVTFDFSLNTMDAVLKSLIDVMKIIEPQYIQYYRQTIKEKSIEYQVDSENFSFNQSTKNEFKQLDDKKEERNIQKSNNKVSGNWNKDNYDYVMKIMATIPEQVLKLRLDNKMTLSQYFQEVVVDRMDENHNYINDDGTLIPVSELIIEEIKKKMYQNKWQEKNLYYVNGILSTLSKDVLKLRISELDELNFEVVLNNDLTFCQYFQEVVVARMDENQNFINYDNSLVLVSEYILSIVNKINERSVNKKR